MKFNDIIVAIPNETGRRVKTIQHSLTHKKTHIYQQAYSALNKNRKYYLEEIVTRQIVVLKRNFVQKGRLTYL